MIVTGERRKRLNFQHLRSCAFPDDGRLISKRTPAAARLLSQCVRRAGSSMRLVRLKPQCPGPDRGLDRPVQRKFSTTFGHEISTEKNIGFLHFFQASGTGGTMIRPCLCVEFIGWPPKSKPLPNYQLYRLPTRQYLRLLQCQTQTCTTI